ncbi:MAG: hypothetical protein GKR90_06345 [Pseudomonadales bacterium]|nr:hypothetical protein [Pseudomonadales bacterium]
MEWQLFALLQMGLIAIALPTAFFFHGRTLKSQNDELRVHVSQLEAKPSVENADGQSPSPREWSREFLATLPNEHPAFPVIKAVLRNAVRPKEDFLEKFPEVINKAGLGGGTEVISDEAAQARIQELEAQLAEGGGASDGGPDDGQAAELKTLLAQFTKDSREMMACIQTLESENAALLAQLEAADMAPVTQQDADDMDQTTVQDEPSEPIAAESAA